MMFANVLVIISFMLSCVAMAGGSSDKDNNGSVKDGAWTIGTSEGGGTTIYYGTKMLVGKTVANPPHATAASTPDRPH
jgi:hypothetical protein